jgi:hypothetical protein
MSSGNSRPAARLPQHFFANFTEPSQDRFEVRSFNVAPVPCPKGMSDVISAVAKPNRLHCGPSLLSRCRVSGASVRAFRRQANFANECLAEESVDTLQHRR